MFWKHIKLLAMTFVIACAVFFICTIGSWAIVQIEICSGVAIAEAEARSPYGDPETMEEITERVRENFSDNNFFLRLASGNEAEAGPIIVACVTAMFLVSLYLLHLASRMQKVCDRESRQKKSREHLHMALEELGPWEEN